MCLKFHEIFGLIVQWKNMSTVYSFFFVYLSGKKKSNAQGQRQVLSA